MLSLAAAYASALVIFGVIDLTWLTFMAPRFYRPVLGNLLLADVNLKAAAAFYLLYPAGLTFFGIAPALKSGDVMTAALMGALFGFFAYGTYDLTNHATLRNWTTTLSVIDIAWGTLVSGIAALSAAWIAAKLV